MSWLKDKIFKKKPNNSRYAEMLNGSIPIFSQFGDNIYVSDVVQQAINCIAREIKKLTPQHVRQNGQDITTVCDSVQRVLDRPNNFMTTTDFLEKIVWQLFFNYNVFIIPTYDTYKDANGNIIKNYTGLYPINPTGVEFLQNEKDEMFIKFSFINGYETTLNYSDVIHIRYNYSVNELMGGNESGQPDNGALLQTLKLNHKLLQGIEKGIEASYAVNGIVKFKTMIDGGKTEKALKELEEKLKNSESGFLPIDISSEFVPITRDIKIVDDTTLEFIDSKILRNFGVPISILTGDYTKSQYEAFYQKTLEPIILSLSQGFTRALFTSRECAYGNKVQFYPKDLIFMTTTETLEMVRLLGDSGSLYENEKRVAFGLKPLPELEGIRMQSLNYVNSDIAKDYQVGEKQNNV